MLSFKRVFMCVIKQGPPPSVTEERIISHGGKTSVPDSRARLMGGKNGFSHDNAEKKRLVCGVEELDNEAPDMQREGEVRAVHALSATLLHCALQHPLSHHCTANVRNSLI